MDRDPPGRSAALIGVGIPSLLVGVVAILLGIPWWIVVAILAVFGLMIILNL